VLYRKISRVVDRKIEENGVVRGADAKEDSIKQRWKEN